MLTFNCSQQMLEPQTVHRLLLHSLEDPTHSSETHKQLQLNKHPMKVNLIVSLCSLVVSGFSLTFVALRCCFLMLQQSFNWHPTTIYIRFSFAGCARSAHPASGIIQRWINGSDWDYNIMTFLTILSISASPCLEILVFLHDPRCTLKYWNPLESVLQSFKVTESWRTWLISMNKTETLHLLQLFPLEVSWFYSADITQ